MVRRLGFSETACGVCEPPNFAGEATSKRHPGGFSRRCAGCARKDRAANFAVTAGSRHRPAGRQSGVSRMSADIQADSQPDI